MRARDQQTGLRYKELVIGYKTIYFNTYTVHVQDLSGEDYHRRALRRHEVSHIWEQRATGKLLNFNQVFAMLTSNGIFLSYAGSERVIKLTDFEGHEITIHS